MLGENYGEKVVVMSDADLRSYVADVITESAREYFKKAPAYEEFVEYIKGLLSEEFQLLEEQGINRVVYFLPPKEGSSLFSTPVFIHDEDKFVEVLEARYGLKDLYEDLKKDLSSSSGPRP